jgi:hypothetical protein
MHNNARILIHYHIVDCLPGNLLQSIGVFQKVQCYEHGQYEKTGYMYFQSVRSIIFRKVQHKAIIDCSIVDLYGKWYAFVVTTYKFKYIDEKIKYS